jgi:hypothetical protein
MEDGSEHGLRIYQKWCYVAFEWSKRPSNGICLKMSRQFDIICKDYDVLIVSTMAPADSILEVQVITDKGTVNYQSLPAPSIKKEHNIPLDGAVKILSITIIIHGANDLISMGWFNFIGLANSKLLDRYLAQWNRFDSVWDLYLMPETYEPEFKVSEGIIMKEKDLYEIRQAHSRIMDREGTTPFTELADIAMSKTPESMIHDYVNFRDSPRFNRERDHGKNLMGHGVNAAIAGLLLKDKGLLRLAARFAMSIAMCSHWDDGMICNLEGSTFDHRCFVQSLCVHETALILDLAGEMFTELGREYLLQRIAKEGLASINFNTWKYDYIFHCNQLAWFTPGRMAGYLLLENHMDRVDGYTDLAFKDLVDSLDSSILSDGGYVEGPMYFNCVGEAGGLSLYMYARARNLDLQDMVPQKMKNTSAFAEAVISTDASQDVIPICDSSPLCKENTMVMMASLLPDSQWVNMYRRSLKRNNNMPSTWLSFLLRETIPAHGPPLKPFINLPDMGIMSSVRTVQGQRVKLFIMGNHAGAGHNHEDKGSFILEFAGETYFMDSGAGNYASPNGLLLRRCHRHNMLVPSGLCEQPILPSPLPVHVRPQGTGDETCFTATIDATPGWESYYEKWIRSWSSPQPNLVLVKDNYKLVQGRGVNFLLHTMLSPRIHNRRITLKGDKGRAVISVPTDCHIEVNQLDLAKDKKQNQISIGREATEGSIEVQIELFLD